jgi:transposase
MLADERVKSCRITQPPPYSRPWARMSSGRSSGTSARTASANHRRPRGQSARRSTSPLNQIDRETPTGRELHLIDDYATHKHPKVRAWLGRHKRFNFHFTATPASWLNVVEGFFAKLTQQRLKRGVFKGIVDLKAVSTDISPEAIPTQALHLDRQS